MMESREANEVTTNWVTASKRGTVSVQMTASDLISLAVNVANGWLLEDLGIDDSAALRNMLGEVYGLLLDANRHVLAARSRAQDSPEATDTERSG